MPQFAAAHKSWLLFGYALWQWPLHKCNLVAARYERKFVMGWLRKLSKKIVLDLSKKFCYRLMGTQVAHNSLAMLLRL